MYSPIFFSIRYLYLQQGLKSFAPWGTIFYEVATITFGGFQWGFFSSSKLNQYFYAFSFDITYCKEFRSLFLPECRILKNSDQNFKQSKIVHSLQKFLSSWSFLGAMFILFVKFSRGYVYSRLIQGLRLLFLPNVPRAMFIQGCTFIPDSRVMRLFPSRKNDIIQGPGMY